MSDGAVHGMYKKLDSTPLSSLTVTGDTTLGDAIVTGSLLATDISSPLTLKLQDLALSGIEFVGGNIKFSKEGLIYGNDLIRGKATVIAGQTEVTVVNIWPETPPSIIVTPEWNTNAWVNNITTAGFKINLSSPPASDSAIYWQAVW